MKVLVTGAAGYIGSHMARLLVRKGHEVIGVDNQSTAYLRELKGGRLYTGCVSDASQMLPLLKDVDTVFHFAASSQVAESCCNPSSYYVNNTVNTLRLLDSIVKAGVPRLVFSSTAAVYGTSAEGTFSESSPTCPVSPYGISKLSIENMLSSYKVHGVSTMAFRYFNAAGASADGDLGESHCPETHLIPNVIKAKLAGNAVSLFGNDYPTPDGTCIRDYIHVEDLCDAHLLGAEYLAGSAVSHSVFNLGTGVGTSVLQIVEQLSHYMGDVSTEILPRRPGDPAKLTADPGLAKSVLGWEPKRTLADICQSAINWETR